VAAVRVGVGLLDGLMIGTSDDGSLRELR
jgi:hypothetical protein